MSVCFSPVSCQRGQTRFCSSLSGIVEVQFLSQHATGSASSRLDPSNQQGSHVVRPGFFVLQVVQCRCRCYARIVEVLKILPFQTWYRSKPHSHACASRTSLCLGVSVSQLISICILWFWFFVAKPVSSMNKDCVCACVRACVRACVCVCVCVCVFAFRFGIPSAPCSSLLIAIFLLILSWFQFQADLKQRIWTFFMINSRGLGERDHRCTSFDGIKNFRLAILPSGVNTILTQTLNVFLFLQNFQNTSTFHIDTLNHL